VDAYILIQTEPGLATTVMDSLVEGGVVNRAVAMTGSHDLLARINDVDWDELTSRLLTRLQRTPGVVRSSTSVVVPETRARTTLPSVPVFHRIARGEIHGLVFAKTESGTARDVARKVRALDGVLGAALVTGDHDLIIQISGRSIATLATTVLNQIQSTPGVMTTSTSLILAATPLTTPAPARRKPARRRKTTARKKPVRRKAAARKKTARRKASARKPVRRKTAARKKTARRR
jgi:DNA-binding Lrp family transcriptional regulator